MAPLMQISKQEILEKSVEFISQNGFNDFSARNLAKFIDISTGPIYSNFKSIDLLVESVSEIVQNSFIQFVEKQSNQHFQSICFAMCHYSLLDKNLFKFLFFTDKNTNLLKTVFGLFLKKLKADPTFSSISDNDKFSILEMVWTINIGVCSTICFNTNNNLNSDRIQVLLNKTFSPIFKEKLNS